MMDFLSCNLQNTICIFQPLKLRISKPYFACTLHRSLEIRWAKNLNWSNLPWKLNYKTLKNFCQNWKSWFGDHTRWYTQNQARKKWHALSHVFWPSCLCWAVHLFCFYFSITTIVWFGFVIKKSWRGFTRPKEMPRYTVRHASNHFLCIIKNSPIIYSIFIVVSLPLPT